MRRSSCRVRSVSDILSDKAGNSKDRMTKQSSTQLIVAIRHLALSSATKWQPYASPGQRPGELTHGNIPSPNGADLGGGAQRGSIDRGSSHSFVFGRAAPLGLDGFGA